MAIVTKTSNTGSIMFDGQPVTQQTQWIAASNWGYSYAAFPITHGVHYITTTAGSGATFGASVYGHSLVDTSSGAFGYTAGYRGNILLTVNDHLSRRSLKSIKHLTGLTEITYRPIPALLIRSPPWR